MRPGTWAGPFPSGAPAIFASVAARLGAPSALAACVGDDAFGRALIERLRRDGVDDEGIVVAPAAGHRGRPRGLSRERDPRLLVLGPRLRGDGAGRADGRATRGPCRLDPCLGVDARVRRRAGAGGRSRRRAGARARRQALAGPERAHGGRAPARDAWRAWPARLTSCSRRRASSKGSSLDAGELARQGSWSARPAGAPARCSSTARRRSGDMQVIAADEVDATGAGDTFAAAFITALPGGCRRSVGGGVRVRDGGTCRRRPGRDGGAGRPAQAVTGPATSTRRSPRAPRARG